MRHPDDSVKIKSERELCIICGTSRPTVRRALSELEREGVLIIRPGSGAFTNPAAAAHRQAPRGVCTLGILLGYGNALVFDSYYWEIVNVVQQHLGRSGMVVLPLLQLTGSDDQAADEILRLKLDAILWLHPVPERLTVIKRLEAENVPVICIGRNPSGNNQSPEPGVVMFNYRESGRNIARYFLSKQQRMPLFAVDGAQEVYTELAQGFMEEMNANGIVPDLRRLLLKPDRIEEDIRQLYAAHLEFDGIFAFAQCAWDVEKAINQYNPGKRFIEFHPVVVYAVRNAWPTSPYLNANGALLGEPAAEYLEAKLTGKPLPSLLYPEMAIIEPR